MESIFNNKIKVLDCTIRDGGHLNSWNFEKKFVREIFRAVSKAGIDYFEIGYRSSGKYFDKEKHGLWRFSQDKEISDVCLGIHGAKLALMADYGKIELPDLEPKAESIITLVRLAAYKKDIKEAVRMLTRIKRMGYEASIQAMGYTSYSNTDREEFVEMLKDSDADYAYVSDSYGSIYPDQIKAIFEPLLKLKPDIELGFHAHNSLQMAFANSIEAVKCGADIIDSTIFGMGRGAGNLPTEIMLAYLQKKMPDKFNVIPVLNCIDKYFIGMQKDIGWGYQLVYLLSGLFECHPSYAQRLISLKEYTMEDVWRALDCINKKNPDRFYEDLIAGIINKGILGTFYQKPQVKVKDERQYSAISTDSPPVPYINRHKGETFLVLGNGPSLTRYKEQIDRFIEEHSPLVLGANYTAGLFKLHCHAFCNKRRFISYVDTVDSESKLMIGQYITKDMISEYTSRPYETIYYLDTLNNDFDIVDGVIQCSCRSVSVLLMGLAIVMGADKIFAAGLDGYLSIGADGDPLFYKEGEEKDDKTLMIELHRSNNRFIKQINDYFLNLGKDGIHIITPTSYSEFYKGIKNYI